MSNSTLKIGIFLLLSTVIGNSNASEKATAKIKVNCKCIALTFDDGPQAKFTPAILAILTKQNIKATFFQVGKNIKNNPQLSQLLAKQGHELGNHTMSHPRLPHLTAISAINSEIKGVQIMLKEVTGSTPTAFRAPFLKYDKRVWQSIKDNNLRAYNASVYADYKGDGDLHDQQVVADHLESITAKVTPGAIVLMHERQKTLHYLNLFIKTLKAQGYHFVTMSQLSKLKHE